MATYQYSAYRAGQKKKVTGRVDANDPVEANHHLRAQGLVPVKISEPTSGHHFTLKRHKVSLQDKIIFTRQLALMTKAGLPLVNALQALARQTDNHYFHEVILKLTKDVQGGRPLSGALNNYPKIFPEVYTAVVKAGESTGQLAEVMFNLADQQEKQAEIISKVRGALLYPAVILVALTGVVFLIVFFVLPSLQSIFVDFGSDLPITTKLLFSGSTLIRHYYLEFFGVLIILFYVLRWWVSKPSGRIVYDHLKVSVPVFGPLTKKVYMANFSRTMAMLVHASLPILQSIKIVQKTINNELYNKSFKAITAAVENGQSLSKAIDKEQIFPPMVGQLISLGEESGDLEAVFTEITHFYDGEVENITRNIASLIEPIMIVIMGLGVGFIVASVLGPIYKLTGSIQ